MVGRRAFVRLNRADLDDMHRERLDHAHQPKSDWSVFDMMPMPLQDAPLRANDRIPSSRYRYPVLVNDIGGNAKVLRGLIEAGRKAFPK